jgi:hypothetical protein
LQNRSHAVMAQRAEAPDSLDDFPTPPWATRALIEHVIGRQNELSSTVCLEAACGRGHMSVVLEEYFADVRSSDVFSYGYGVVRDYLSRLLYGKKSIPAPFAITGAELDTHFGWPIYEAVEEINELFNRRLFEILAG